MKRMRALVSLLILIILTISLFGCGETQSQPGESTPSTTPGENLEIMTHSMTTDEDGNLIVKGSAKTVFGIIIYAEIRVKFYDAAGNLLDTSLDSINDLGPREIWVFEFIYHGVDTENVKSYDIEIVTIEK